EEVNESGGPYVGRVCLHPNDFLNFASFGIGAKVPMSTTWVFLGMLAGREVALRIRLREANTGKVWPMVFSDLGKATLGLVISVALVILLYLIEGRDLNSLLSSG
ncbi:MAG: hypothetical protein AAGK24_02045, partial [Planctomycetota bacterium]